MGLSRLQMRLHAGWIRVVVNDVEGERDYGTDELLGDGRATLA